MFFGAQRTKGPAHERINRHFLCSGISLWKISFSRCVPCRSSLSDVFGVLWNSLGFSHCVCITNAHTVLALFPKNIRAFALLLTVPEGF